MCDFDTVYMDHELSLRAKTACINFQIKYS